jgi:allantoinase
MPGDPIAGPDLLVRSRRVVTADGPVPAIVAVTNGKISAIRPFGAAEPTGAAGRVLDLADDEVLLPGLVDTHVHVNEPGRTQWEGFATATAAAAAGGITTIADMPLNSVPPTTDVAALRLKRAAASGQCRIDVGFWGGAVPGNASSRRALHDAGVLGFKCFTVDSGVPEFPPLDRTDLECAARQLAEFDGLLLVHAEDAACIARAAQSAGRAAGGRDYAAFLRSRPDEAETAAVAQVIEVGRRTGVRLHILHVSSAAVLPLLRAARADGLRITAETCPHYLALAAEEIPAGATQFKCCPPIRARVNRELLWQGLRTGMIDCVVSDHSPCPPALKRLDAGDFAAAWGGIASLQLALSVVWTFGRERGCSVADVARWMAAAPAAMAGLPDKGAIAVGRDADLVAFAPDAEFTVEPDALLHRHKLTPYAGRRLTGLVRRTWLRGRQVHPSGTADDDQPAGRLLARPGSQAGGS